MWEATNKPCLPQRPRDSEDSEGGDRDQAHRQTQNLASYLHDYRPGSWTLVPSFTLHSQVDQNFSFISHMMGVGGSKQVEKRDQREPGQ